MPEGGEPWSNSFRQYCRVAIVFYFAPLARMLLRVIGGAGDAALRGVRMCATCCQQRRNEAPAQRERMQ
jgi:hypothetical protein